VKAVVGRSGPTLTLSLENPGPAGFYRIDADPDSRAEDQTGGGGAEVFGYARKLEQELERLGFISVEQFAQATPQPAYLPGITWDPTTALFWTNFSTNAVLGLNAAELALFRTNGFVVSERLGDESFGESYYRVFHGDMPVFITADSILHAWHRTYLGMLEELEEFELSTLLEAVLTNMAAALPDAWASYGNGPLRDSILDADYFLTVARSLWASQQVANCVSVPGEELRVTATLGDIKALQLKPAPVFGSERMVDFSQFQVRGNYTRPARLGRYFQAMMWCGRTELRVVTYPPNQENDIRQLGTAIILHHLLREAGQFENWWAIEQITRAFVGTTDSMNFLQLGQLLAAAGIRSPADVPDLATLTNLQTRLLTGELGMQNITGDALKSPTSAEELKLPRAFTFCGQKFTLDSWALSHLVFDKVHWPCSTNCGPGCGTTNINGKVARRKPSCLDVAFSVLGNTQAAPEILTRILNPGGVPFRDGLPYQHNLLAVRNVVDSQSPEAWTDNIYTAWLGALRALSEPTVGSEYPEAMRTRAWAMKALNTQMASWTELRHDTVLYAKQSYTPFVICSYPHGFVEPLPQFWASMKTLADVAADSIGSLPMPSWTVTVPGRSIWSPTVTSQLSTLQSNQVAALQYFSAQMRTLQRIAEKELQQVPLDAVETDFLKSVVENHGVCTGGPRFTGWYPNLFYRNAFWHPADFVEFEGCGRWDALVVDVHTDTPDPFGTCDPGAVIHEATGDVHLMLIAVDNGPDRIAYAGPVLSHYEFEVPGVRRKTDEEWQTEFRRGGKPPSPEWTRGYLVPFP